MATDNNQIKRWILPKPISKAEINDCAINYTLQKVLCRRGINLEEELTDFITPLELPNPESHFIELNKATERIIQACNSQEKIAICGDYDADGITSTVLLVELLSKLGALPISYIPSRQDDGYGLNIKMINEIYRNDIKIYILRHNRNPYILRHVKSNCMTKSTQNSIKWTCNEIRDLLLEKNKAYGDSAIQPENIFSKLDNAQAICARIDDKLSRIKQKGLNDLTEDTVQDLIGYLILYKVQVKKEENKITGKGKALV